MGKCLHVLDLFKKSLLMDVDTRIDTKFCSLGKLITKMGKRLRILIGKKKSEDSFRMIRSATELIEAGVEFKRSMTTSLNAITFKQGILSLPYIIVNDATESMFLNLIMYEHLHMGAGNDISSYIAFMDCIIDNERDVALLNSRGILENLLGSDKEVAKMFNSLRTDMPFNWNDSLFKVLEEVNDYCKKPWNKWRANLIHTYFTNPWAMVSLIAAIFLFALATIQTVYTILGTHT